jgi:hypothetical protein
MGIDRLLWTSTAPPTAARPATHCAPSGDTGIGAPKPTAPQAATRASARRSICCRGSSTATPITEPTHGGQQYFASRREHHTGGEVLDHTRGLRPTSRRAKSELIALLQEVGKLSSRNVFDKENDKDERDSGNTIILSKS